MTDEDARSLPEASQAQAALRIRAVRAVLGGMTQAQAARVFGVHPERGEPLESNAIDRAASRGCRRGVVGVERAEQAALDRASAAGGIALVPATRPGPAGVRRGFSGPVRRSAELIARRYGVRLARTTMGAYLRGWGFMPRSHSGGPWSRTRPRYAAGRRRTTPPSVPRPVEAGWCCGWMRWELALRMRSAGRSWWGVETPVIKADR